MPSVGYSLSARSIAKLKEAFPEAFAMCEAVGSAQPSSSTPMMLKERPLSFSTMPNQRQIPVYAPSLLFPEEESPSLAGELEIWESDLARPAAYMPAPFSLGDANRYFAIYIPSEAMEPRFRAGERVVFDKVKPASIGADVLVQLHDEGGVSLWTIGKLNSRDRNLISLIQHREPLSASIHRSKIKHIFPFVGMLDDDA